MLAILLAVIFGLGVGYFATENTVPVALRLGDFVIENVPLYLVAVGSLLVGLVIAALFYAARSFTGSTTTLGKERDTSMLERDMANLKYRVNELETANNHVRLERSSDARIAAVS
jgi:uncharacterized integral membrane protein